MDIKKQIITLILLVVFTVTVKDYLYQITEKNEIQDMKIDAMEYRMNFFSDEQLKGKVQLSEECRRHLDYVKNDTNYYPVPESTVDKSLFTAFENSWMNQRSYGGERGHEGTDIMVSENKRGVFPVVSMSNGVITNLGWLEKGGYRVGITSDSGIYYYYAHLDSFAAIKKGDYIKAGQLIGFIGDTGYGPEGTKGKFPVHLHVGIYIYRNGKEISINPYYLLKFLENKKLKYAYS